MYRTIRHCLYFFSLMAVLPVSSTAGAQRLPGGISGVITDKDGYGVNAIITVLQSSRTIAGTTVDENGRFMLKSLAGGTYDIMVKPADTSVYHTKVLYDFPVYFNRYIILEMRLDVKAPNEDVKVEKHIIHMRDPKTGDVKPGAE
jgi:hypothetical protein